MRSEFSEQTKWDRFQAAGGRCECVGCGSCRGSLLFAIGGGRCLTSFRWGQSATADMLFGYQFDHRTFAWDASLSNCRLLCIGCHKETPTYGSGFFKAIVEAMQENERRKYAGLGAALSHLGPQQPTYLSQAAELLNPPSPYQSTLRALFGDPPKRPTLADLIGPPPKTGAF
jgi:hypothetical protein